MSCSKCGKPSYVQPTGTGYSTDIDLLSPTSCEITDTCDGGCQESSITLKGLCVTPEQPPLPADLDIDFGEVDCITAQEILDTAMTLSTGYERDCGAGKSDLAILANVIYDLNAMKLKLTDAKMTQLQKLSTGKFKIPSDVNIIASISLGDADEQKFGDIRLSQVSPENFTHTKFINVYTIVNGTLIIKELTSLQGGCSCPDSLRITYYPRIKVPKTLEECLNISRDVMNLIVHKTIYQYYGSRFKNEFAIQTSKQQFDAILENFDTWGSSRISGDASYSLTPRYNSIGY